MCHGLFTKATGGWAWAWHGSLAGRAAGQQGSQGQGSLMAGSGGVPNWTDQVVLCDSTCEAGSGITRNSEVRLSWTSGPTEPREGSGQDHHRGRGCHSTPVALPHGPLPGSESVLGSRTGQCPGGRRTLPQPPCASYSCPCQVYPWSLAGDARALVQILSSVNLQPGPVRVRSALRAPV